MTGYKIKAACSVEHGVCFALLMLGGCSSATPAEQLPVAGGVSVGPTQTSPATAAGAAAAAVGGAKPAAGGSTASATGGTTGGSVPVVAAGGAAPVTAGDVPATSASAGASAQAGTPATVQAGTGGTTTPTGGVSQWTMIGHDAASTYLNADETVLTKANAATLAVAWQIDMGTNVYGAPLQVGDTIYASASTGVRALDANTGKAIWMGQGSTTGSLAYDNGLLYLYTGAGNITALDAMTGTTKWSMAPMGNPGGDGSSSPTIGGDLVYIGGSNGGSEVIGGRFRGFLAALDKKTGAGVWTTYTVPATAAGASLWSSVGIDVAAGVVFGTTGNNHGTPGTDTSDSIIAFDMAKGDIKWKNQRTADDCWGPSNDSPDADFGASPVLYEAPVGGVMTKIVSAGQKTGQAHALRRDTGEMLWTRVLCTGMNTRDGKLGIFVNGAWTGKNMVFACNKDMKSTLFGLDGVTGDIAWMAALPGPVYGRISVANGVVFAGAGANLVAVDADTGAVITTVPSKGGTVAGTITIANGRVAYGEGLSWADGVAGRTLTVLKVQ